MTYQEIPIPPDVRKVTITHNGKQTVIDVPKGAAASIQIWSGGGGGGGSAPAAGIGPEEVER